MHAMQPQGPLQRCKLIEQHGREASMMKWKEQLNFQITAANTVVGFAVEFFRVPASAVLGDSCKIIFTRLQ